MAMRPSNRISNVFSVLTALLGIAIFAVSFAVDGIPVPFAHWRLGEWTIRIAGIVLLLLAILARWAPPQWSLSLMALSYSLVAMFAVCYRPAERGDVEVGLGHSQRVYINKDYWFDNINQPDPYFGHFSRPNAYGRTHHPDFDASYHLDADGFRRMPEPTSWFPKLEIWFTGCSTTFGDGVDDTESYPAVLAKEAWPDMRVRNYAFNAWGTPQAYLVLKRQFSRAKRPPDLVVYGWIEHHLARSYLRKSWRSNFDAPFPLFEVKDGQLEYQRLGRKEDSILPDSPETDEAERTVAGALIGEMKKLCDEHGSKLVILGIHAASEFIPRLCERLNIPFIDLSSVVPYETHPREGHPNKYWHRSTARWLAESDWLSQETALPALHRPGTVTPTPVHWALETLGPNVLAAGLSPQDGMGNRIAVREIDNPGKSEQKIKLKRGPISLKKGQRYSVEFKANGDAERRLEMVGNVDRVPWTQFMQPMTITIHPEWEDYRLVIEAAETVDSAIVGFLFDGNPASFEIDQFKIIEVK